MKTSLLTFLLLALAPAASAESNWPLPLNRQELITKIVEAGVPRRGIERIYKFRDQTLGASFVTDTYICAGRPAGDVSACRERDRIFATKTLTLEEHDYAVYIDFKQPSRLKRLWLINLRDGSAEWQLVAHGAGSGKEGEAERFSNRRNSRMTSLGMYVAGDTYRSGKHGLTMRLYGLERSNSNAYLRDIVFHGAKYATEDYLDKKRAEVTFDPDKIGESWGCPAVDDSFAQRVIPLLKNGALFFHDHADLLEPAMSGEEVSLPQIIRE